MPICQGSKDLDEYKVNTVSQHATVSNSHASGVRGSQEHANEAASGRSLPDHDIMSVGVNEGYIKRKFLR